MNWAGLEIQQCLWDFADRLVEDSKKLVDDTGRLIPTGTVGLWLGCTLRMEGS